MQCISLMADNNIPFFLNFVKLSYCVRGHSNSHVFLFMSSDVYTNIVYPLITNYTSSADDNTTCNHCTLETAVDVYYTMIVKGCVTYFHTVALNRPFIKSYKQFLKKNNYNFEKFSIAVQNNSLVQYPALKTYKVVSKFLN
jgi:hypothetical protein